MISYLPKLNSISECSNRIINTKTQTLITDIGVNKNLWPEAIKILTYLANRTETSTYNSIPLEVFLYAYYRENNNYT